MCNYVYKKKIFKFFGRNVYMYYKMFVGELLFIFINIKYLMNLNL